MRASRRLRGAAEEVVATGDPAEHPDDHHRHEDRHRETPLRDGDDGSEGETTQSPGCPGHDLLGAEPFDVRGLPRPKLATRHGRGAPDERAHPEPSLAT